ncbi:MAG: transposase [Chloroflexi bacterium]|nr:transposase [Chloroflexota bacterium]
MARRKTVFNSNNYYHIYNRGAHKINIFRNDRDYVFLLKLVKEQAQKCDITVIAYCLMDNHYHLSCVKMGILKSVNSCRRFSMFIQKSSMPNTNNQGRCSKGHLKPFMWIVTNICFIFADIFIATQWKLAWWLSLNNGIIQIMRNLLGNEKAVWWIKTLSKSILVHPKPTKNL